MKFQFKDQAYQLKAVDSVIRVFEGQPLQNGTSYQIDQGHVSGQTELILEDELTGYRNAEVVLSQDEIFKNIRQLQDENNIIPSKDLVKDLGCCQLDIEMETGTGKTYVYIRTMFELNRRYGWTKFIVVVPSIAIREGVNKTFEITADHFMEIYGKKVNFFVYNSDELSKLDSDFSQSADISVMIINTQAFNTSMKEEAKNKAARIIYDIRDEFQSRRPIDVISANRPIIILDEPQKMGGVATQKALKRFHPLFTLNYSATHKDAHNLIYVLDAIDAFNQRLVKKIDVIGFKIVNLQANSGYVYFDELILSTSHDPQVKLEIDVKGANGAMRRVTKVFDVGDSIYDESNELEEYRHGYVIDEIIVDPEDSSQSELRLSNGVKLHPKEACGNIEEKYKVRIQIRETLRAHFKKESELFAKGIKCLSLFFLDEVANYRCYDDDGNQLTGPYGKIFEEEYADALREFIEQADPKYRNYLENISPDETHTGYFSVDKKNHVINGKIDKNGDADDISAYDLILKNKERLLSLQEPVRFIFSHSALREGWDNPNVFQICTLRQSDSETRKRQEIGRGLRLCVNQQGQRQDIDVLEDKIQDVNRLTVVASESYEKFAKDLQDEFKNDRSARPEKVDVEFLTDKEFPLGNGKKYRFSKEESNNIFIQLCLKGYVDLKTGKPTDKFKDDVANNRLEPLTDEMTPYTEVASRVLQSIYNPSAINSMISNGAQAVVENRINENFDRKEFQELWKRINHYYNYSVNFDSEELINEAVKSINKSLSVSKLRIQITRASQKDRLSDHDLRSGEMLNKDEQSFENIGHDVKNHVRYDLLGKIASETKLTRRTVATILQRISPEKFAMYGDNPEQFIAETSRLILEQKSTMIVEHITYDKIEGCYDSSIFTEEKHSSCDKAFSGTKSVTDYVFTDGVAGKSIEYKFVEDLDKAKEVMVYAKLPKGFKIPTPMGNYSPDWAIAFNDHDSKIKHIFFVAETKGSLKKMDLRGVENAKIECAKALFAQLCIHENDVTYEQVTNYKDLMDKVMQ